MRFSAAIQQVAEPLAGEPRHIRLDHVERRGGRSRRVEGVAALLQQRRARLRGERMRCRDHAPHR